MRTRSVDRRARPSRPAPRVVKPRSRNAGSHSCKRAVRLPSICGAVPRTRATEQPLTNAVSDGPVGRIDTAARSLSMVGAPGGGALEAPNFRSRALDCGLRDRTAHFAAPERARGARLVAPADLLFERGVVFAR